MSQTKLNEAPIASTRVNKNRNSLTTHIVHIAGHDDLATVLKKVNCALSDVLTHVNAATHPRVVMNYNGINKFFAKPQVSQIVASIQIDRSTKETISRFEHVFVSVMDTVPSEKNMNDEEFLEEDKADDQKSVDVSCE